MWRATLKGIFARKLRLALTTLAVLLGVAFVSGTYVLTDTMERSFDQIFRRTVTDVDLVVRARDPYTGGGSQRTRIPDSTLARIRDVDGVATADGTTFGYAQLVGRNGDSIQNGLAPTIGLSWPESGAGPLRARERRARAGPPAATAKCSSTRARQGRTASTSVIASACCCKVRPSSSGSWACSASRARPTSAASPSPRSTFRPRSACSPRRACSTPSTSRPIPGVTPAAVSSKLAATLGPSFEVVPAAKLAEERAEPVRQGVGNLRVALVGFAAVGLVVGSFIIFNTFAILIAQRTRELGLLRALGASRSQVLWSVVARGRDRRGRGGRAWARGRRRDCARPAPRGRVQPGSASARPRRRRCVLGRTIIAAVLVGVVVTVGRVAHSRSCARRGPRRWRRSTSCRAWDRRHSAGALPSDCSSRLRASARSGSASRSTPPQLARRVQVVAVGALLAFFGVVMLVAALARPMARVIGWLLSRRGVTGRLAQGNAMRNPRRTAATSAALVVGLSLVCLVAIVSASVKSSIRTGVQRGVRADYVLSAQGLTGFSPQVSERIASLPAVQATTGLRLGRVRVGERQQLMVAVDPAVLDRVLDLDIRAGDAPGTGDGRHAAVPGRGRALRRRARRSAASSSTRSRVRSQVPIAGVYARKQFTGAYPVPLGVVSIASEEQNFGGVQQDTLVYVKAKPGESAAARRQIEDAHRRRLPERPDRLALGVPGQAGGHRRPVRRRARRLARPVRDHRRARHHQHAALVCLRANAGAGPAARRRHVAGPSASDGARRVDHHRRHRVHRRLGARDLLGLGVHDGAARARPRPVRRAAAADRGVPRVLGDRRHGRGVAAGMAGVAPRRPRGDRRGRERRQEDPGVGVPSAAAAVRPTNSIAAR